MDRSSVMCHMLQSSFQTLITKPDLFIKCAEIRNVNMLRNSAFTQFVRKEVG
jgi:hypothetical protein